MTGAEDALAAMDAAGIDVAVICAFPWRDMDLARESNDYILECLERHPGRFIGLCCANPAAGEEAAQEARRCLEAGMRGIGELHGEPQAFNPRDFDLMRPLVRAAMEFDASVMIHVNEPVGHKYVGKGNVSPYVVYPLILEFPEVDWILPHWGGGLFVYELMPEVAEACRRVYYDSAASPFLYRPDIYRIAPQITDPHPRPLRDGFSIAGICSAPSRTWKEPAWTTSSRPASWGATPPASSRSNFKRQLAKAPWTEQLTFGPLAPMVMV